MSPVHQKMSVGLMSKTQSSDLCRPTMYPPWPWTMPLGSPVVPEVCRMKSGSSASMISVAASERSWRTRASYQMSRASLISTSSLARLTTTTVSTQSHPPTRASSTVAFRLMMRPLR